MDRKIAEELIRLARLLDAPLNAATEAANGISDLNERKNVRRAIAAITEKAYDMTRPILRDYPDLDPDR